MFKNLISFWKGRGYINEVLEEFNNMMQNAEKMFSEVCGLLIRGETKKGLKDNIYSIDKQVNNLERDIRKRVVAHLAFNNATDVPFSLVLMSVVKDAERLGDYSKNLFEVWELMRLPLNQDLYKKYFDNLDTKILDQFKQTIQAFMQSDEDTANKMLLSEREILKKCDIILEHLSKSNLDANEAVCFTLIARYFKRISAHLTNIGSSVVMPITDLDFFDEKLRHNIK